MTSNYAGATIDDRGAGLSIYGHPERAITRLVVLEDKTGAPLQVGSVGVRVDDTVHPATGGQLGVWTVTIPAPALGTAQFALLIDDSPVTTGQITGTYDPARWTSDDPLTVQIGDGGTITVTVLSTGGGGGGPSTPLSDAPPSPLGAVPDPGTAPAASRSDHVHPYPTPAEIGAVDDTDPRLTDARTPLPHTHPASDITGLPAVPGLTTDPAEALGTAAAGTSGDAARADHVHPMPNATDVGADPAGTAAGLVAEIDTGVLEIQEGPGVTVDDTDPARPVVSATGGGGGGGAPDPSGWRDTWIPGQTYPPYPMINPADSPLISANRRAHAIPLLIPDGATIDAASLEITSTGTAVWLVVYTSQPNPGGVGKSPHQPAAVLGAAPATSTGWITITGIGWTKPAGDHWLVIASDGGVRYRTATATIPEWFTPPAPDQIRNASREYTGAVLPVAPSDPTDVDDWPDLSPQTAGSPAPTVYLTAGVAP